MRAELAVVWGVGCALAFAVGVRAEVPAVERLVLCDSCHAAEAPARPERVPVLAGQPARFLEEQLTLFRSGVRVSTVMEPIARSVAPEEDRRIAEHYASRPSAPLPGSGPGSRPRDAVLFSRGRAIARNRVCGSCHGQTFRGRDRVPRLAGQREDYLRVALAAYRDSRRASPERVMNVAAEKLPDEHIAALAHYLSRCP